MVDGAGGGGGDERSVTGGDEIRSRFPPTAIGSLGAPADGPDDPRPREVRDKICVKLRAKAGIST